MKEVRFLYEILFVVLLRLFFGAKIALKPMLIAGGLVLLLGGHYILRNVTSPYMVVFNPLESIAVVLFCFAAFPYGETRTVEQMRGISLSIIVIMLINLCRMKLGI